MITGDLKSRIDRIWDAFWSGGIANPLEVMEELTYLLHPQAGRLHTARENKVNARHADLGRDLSSEE